MGWRPQRRGHEDVFSRLSREEYDERRKSGLPERGGIVWSGEARGERNVEYMNPLIEPVRIAG